MKKLLFMFLIALMSIGTVDAQSSKDYRKIAKAAKKEAKQLKSDGYRLLEPGTLEEVIVDFRMKDRTSLLLLQSEVRGKKSINMASLIARNNIINQYAENAKTIVKGRITSSASDLNGEEVENLASGFERLVLKELNGEIRTAYTLVRESSKGFDIRLVCFVDLDELKQIREDALNRALKQTEYAAQYGNQVSDWVNQGFESETEEETEE